MQYHTHIRYLIVHVPEGMGVGGSGETLIAAASPALPSRRWRTPTGKAPSFDNNDIATLSCGNLLCGELSNYVVRWPWTVPHNRWSLDAGATSLGALGDCRTVVLCGRCDWTCAMIVFLRPNLAATTQGLVGGGSAKQHRRRRCEDVQRWVAGVHLWLATTMELSPCLVPLSMLAYATGFLEHVRVRLLPLMFDFPRFCDSFVLACIDFIT